MSEQKKTNSSDSPEKKKKIPGKDFQWFTTAEEWDAMAARGLEKIRAVANDPERRFNLATAPAEKVKLIRQRAAERHASRISKAEFISIIKPVYEGILTARLSKKEVYNLFVSSFYMLVELTKKHRLVLPEIGKLWSANVIRSLPFRYRFRMSPSKRFKEICDNTNLFQYFRPRVTKKTKKFVDKRGETIVDYESILRSYIDSDKEEKRINNYNKYTTTKE